MPTATEMAIIVIVTITYCIVVVTWTPTAEFTCPPLDPVALDVVVEFDVGPVVAELPALGLFVGRDVPDEAPLEVPVGILVEVPSPLWVVELPSEGLLVVAPDEGGLSPGPVLAPPFEPEPLDAVVLVVVGACDATSPPEPDEEVLGSLLVVGALEPDSGTPVAEELDGEPLGSLLVVGALEPDSGSSVAEELDAESQFAIELD